MEIPENIFFPTSTSFSKEGAKEKCAMGLSMCVASENKTSRSGKIVLGLSSGFVSDLNRHHKKKNVCALFIQHPASGFLPPRMTHCSPVTGLTLGYGPED